MREIKSELRKLLSVRSTYLILAVTVGLLILVGFYIEGFRLDNKQLNDPLLLNHTITDAINALILLPGIIGVLLMTHEYRYNTIVYTLTATRSRSKVLLAKIISMSLVALFFCALIGIFSPILTYLGVHAAHHGSLLPAQHIYYSDVIWRLVYYGWGYVMLALMLAVIIRNQVATIVSLFLIPTIEQLLTLLLKDNSVYLPFTALGSLVTEPTRGHITHAHAAMTFAVYLIVGWAAAWFLFLRRDAN